MKNLLKSGKNCWCREPAERIAFLVDGQAVFEAFEALAEQAEKSLLIIGWDIDSRVRMNPSPFSEGAPSPTLGDFLEDLAERKSGLETHILIWDFPVIYAADREPLPIFNLDWKSHRRIHFALDGEHPLGASHHQKIVVVDDHLAMAGGFDLSNSRWDTPEHQPDDPRRVDPLGNPYPPFHDVQMLVQGPVAGKLGELARERWYRATGKRLPKPSRVGSPPWPLATAPDLTDVSVALARTEPAYKNRQEIAEVRQLFENSIAAAKSYIYIENQYLTSRAVLKALLASLEAENGPEIVIVLPKSNTGWLEENTMGRLRSVALQALAEGDRHGRLGVYCPIIQGAEPGQQIEVRVHSKVMIVDDRFVRVGSANLNNRSMGLDTECDLAIELPEAAGSDNGIVRLRNRLLAEHLNETPARVGEAIAEQNSLLRAVETLSGNVHTLEVLHAEPPSPLTALTETSLLDPEQPVQLDRMMDRMLVLEEADADGPGSGKMKLIGIVLIALVLVGLWRLTPLRDYLDAARLVSLAATLRENPLSWLYILLAYVLGGLIFFPVTVQVVATSALLPPLWAFLYSLGGCMVSAAITFGVGHWLGRDAIRTVAGGRLNKISRQVARKGLIAVGALRLVPVAPFTLVNLVAGASHIRFRDYLLGTLIGMLPGIAGLTLLTDRLKAVITEPGVGNMLLLLLLLLVVGVGGYYLKKRLSRQG